jgi:long-subunit fatty acid transport protein
LWLAAGSAAQIGLDPTQVVIAISGLLVAVITAAAGVTVAIVNSKGKSNAAHSSALEPDDWAFVRERVAVVEAQLRDEHATNNIQDRRLDRIERAYGLDGSEWQER